MEEEWDENGVEEQTEESVLQRMERFLFGYLIYLTELFEVYIILTVEHSHNK